MLDLLHQNRDVLWVNKHSILFLLSFISSLFLVVPLSGTNPTSGANHDFRRLRKHCFCSVRFEACWPVLPGGSTLCCLHWALCPDWSHTGDDSCARMRST